MKKKFNLALCFVLSLIFITFFSIVTYAAVEIEGAGTETSPYLIKNENQLLALVRDEYSSSAYYRLENDIELITRSWVPIGTMSESGFSGDFDGNNHKITSLAIDTATNSYSDLGLFSENNGTISNLTIEISSIIGNKSTGGIAASNNGVIKNCHVSGLISADDSYNEDAVLGGIAGNNLGKILDCTSEIEIKNGNTKTGGIVGFSDSEAEISNCEFNGTAADMSTIYFGGIVGYTKGTVTKCSNRGIISSNIRHAGGVAAYAESGLIAFCSSVSDITSTTTYDSYIGGLIGYNKGAEVENCYSIGNITCLNTSSYNTYVGGFIGENESENYVKNCYCSGKVIGKTSSAFANGTSSLYENCFYNETIQMTSENWVYGLSESAMKDITSREKNYTFWDFDTVWGMNSNINDGFPYLISLIEPATGIKISETSIALALGETIKITAEVLPSSATNQSYTWISSNKDVASIDSSGIITANGIGSAVITASSNDGNFTADCSVTVTANTSSNETLIFKIDDYTTVRGEKISVPVRLLTGNSTGVSSFSADIYYNSSYLKPELSSFQKGDLFSDMEFSVDKVNKVIHITAKSDDSTIGAGILCYLEFKTTAIYKYQNVSSKLTMYIKELNSVKGNTVKSLKSSAYEGIITIKDIMYGNVDEDNAVTARDAALVLEKALNSSFSFPIETE